MQFKVNKKKANLAVDKAERTILCYDEIWTDVDEAQCYMLQPGEIERKLSEE